MRIKHFVSLLRVGIKPAGWETEVGKCPVSGDLEEKRRNSALLLAWRKDNHGWKKFIPEHIETWEIFHPVYAISLLYLIYPRVRLSLNGS